MKRLAERKDRKGERGSVLAMSAISMLALLLATGLAVDVSHFYTAKVELQNAADAAALAAASQLNSTSGGIKCAINEATKALNKYDFKTNVTITSADITFATNLNGSYIDSASAIASPTNIRFVKVAIPPKPVGVTFAAIALGPTQTIPATATAGLSIGLSMNKFYTAYTFIESPAAPIVKGTALTLNAKAYNDTAPTSYRVLAGPDGDLLLTGPMHAYGYIGSSYNIAALSAAEMCRYAKIGTNTRFGDYSPTNVHPSVNPVDEPPDLITQENITYQQYTDMQGNGTVQDSRRREESPHHDRAHRLEHNLQRGRQDSRFKSSGCLLHSQEDGDRTQHCELQSRRRVHRRAAGGSRRHLHARWNADERACHSRFIQMR